MQQRKADSHRGGDAGRNVTYSHSSQRGWTIDLSYPIGNTGIGLADKVVTRFVRERPGLPSHRNRTHDYLRIDGLDVLIRKSQPVDHSRREVLNYNIDLWKHRHHYLACTRFFEIDREAQL